MLQGRLYDATMADDHLMLASAALFWAHVAIGSRETTARPHFDMAMSWWQGSKALRDRCGLRLSNWDTPCAHAMLLLVQVCCRP